MIYSWYKIINAIEFEALGIPSRELQFLLTGVGLKTVLIVRGGLISLVYEGVMLTPNLVGMNPFAFGGFAAYLDAASDLWLGIPVDES